MTNKDQAAADIKPVAEVKPTTVAKAAKVLTSDQVDKLIYSDEFAGQGGDYEIRNGVRVRVAEPTVDHPEGNCARNADGVPISQLDREAAERAAADAK